MVITEDLAGTFTGTITGTLTDWSLDPGDGSAPYTGSGASISQAHTYTNPGTYNAVLTCTGTSGVDTGTITGIVVSAVTAPAIRVTGNDVEIADGDATASGTDHTLFDTVTENGATFSRTFTVTNTGSANLVTSGMTAPAGFTITEGLTGTITPGNSDTFTVRLDASTVGVKSGDISFTTNVTGQNPFNFAISGEVLSAGAVAFQSITTLKSDTSGEHWVSPFGIPIPKSVRSGVTAGRRTKFFARYPAGGGGTLYPIQAEQFRSGLNGVDLMHCTGHVKLPAGYTAQSIVEIGYSDTQAVPSNPVYPAVADDIEVSFTFRTPRVHYIAHGTKPFTGDVLTVEITDSLGTLTYNSPPYYIAFSTRIPYQRGGGFYDTLLQKMITQDPAGRYTSLDNLAAPMKDWFRPEQSSYNEGFDVRYAPWDNARQSHKRGAGSAQVNSGLTRPYANDSATQQWPDIGFYIWPRAGTASEDYTVTASFARNGTKIPVANKSLIDGPTEGAFQLLNYKERTQTFTSDGFLRGQTSGTRCYFVADNVSGGTTGTLRVQGILGSGFIDGETLSAYNGISETTISGVAKVDGAVGYETVTSSSGGSARFLSVDSETQNIYVSNINGTFLNGDTITTPYGSTTQTGTAVASTASVYTAYATQAQSGTVTPINDSAADFTRSVTFNAAAATADSPWFDGHQVRQVERRIAVPNTDLDVLFYVTWDRDGTIIDRQVCVENSRMGSSSIDWWYDVDIKVGGVSQTVGQAKYQGLIHEVWQSWRWKQSKPLGMCDPADFMLARLIHPWRRYPTKDMSYEISPFVLGGNAVTQSNFRLPGVVGPGFAGAVKSTFNDPLYPGNYMFGREPGQRPELGDFNTTEYLFWATNSFLAWPSMEAMADNVMGAQGYWIRHEQGTGEEAYNPPDFYASYKYTPHGPVSSLPAYAIGRPFDSGATRTPLRQRYSLSLRFFPANSHSCSPGQFSAFLAVPEKRFYDGCKMFAWYQILNTESKNILNTPKTGGVAGDANHKIGVQTANGVRQFARPARDIFQAAFIHHEGSRQRTTYRRVAQDQADFANASAANTIWGIFLTRASTEGGGTLWWSDRWTDKIQPWLPGGTLLSITNPVSGIRVDLFKELFINTTMSLCQHLEVADASEFLEKSNWHVRWVQNAPYGNWWNGILGGSGNASMIRLAKNLEWSSQVGNLTATDAAPYAIHDTEAGGMANLKALAESLTTPEQKSTLSIYDNVGSWAGFITPGTPGYNFPRTQVGALLIYEEYGSDPDLRLAATAAVNTIDTAYPGDTVITSGDSRIIGYTYSQIWQQTGFVGYSQVVNWT